MSPNHTEPAALLGRQALYCRRAGEDWYTLKPVYGIAFLDLEFFGHQQSPHTCFELRERRTPELVFSEELAIHLLELSKYSGFTQETPPSTPLERWVYTLQRVGTGDELMKKITQDDEMIAETERRYREFVEDPEARRAALERDIYIRDRGQMIRDAREEGIERGIEQGIEQGIQVGREETARDVAMRLIESGIDDNVIQKATGLSSDELNTLRTQR